MKYLQSKYLKKARICSYLSLHKNIPYAAQTGRFWHYPCGGKEKSFLDDRLENGSFDSRLLFYVTSKQLLLEIMTTTGFSDSYGPVNCKMNENTTNRHNHLTSEFHIFSYPGNKLI